MKAPAFLLGLTLLSASASAQVLSPDPTTAWAAFQARHGSGAFQAQFNRATGTPEAIYGQGLRVAPAVDGALTARRLAIALLDQHADLLGRGTSTFVPVLENKVRRLFVLVFAQRFAGLEVIGGRADVRLNENGVVAMFGASAVPIPADFVVTPIVAAATANTTAHAHLGVPGPLAGMRADLVIHADVHATERTTPRLAWRVPIDHRAGRLLVGTVFVDAQTGAVIEFVDDVHHCADGHVHVRGSGTSDPLHTVPTGGHVGREIARRNRERKTPPSLGPALLGSVMAWVNRGDPLTPLTNEPLQGVRVVAAGVGSTYSDANGNFVIPYTGTTPVTLTVDFAPNNVESLPGGLSPSRLPPVSGSVQATPGVPATIQLLASNAPESDWSQTTTVWHVDAMTRWTRGVLGTFTTPSSLNAYVNVALTCNATYGGLRMDFYAAGGGCNMTAFSSIIRHEWGHAADDSFGGISRVEGLSEGWADTFAILSSGDPVVGRNFYTSGASLRDARNSLRYPVASGSVHTQGMTWMGFAWDLRELLVARLGTAAGSTLTAELMIGALPANPTNQPGALREVFLVDDDDANLNNGTPNCLELTVAARRRSLPLPINRCYPAGIWTTFGTPCPGSPVASPYCAVLNDDTVASAGGFFSNEFAYGHTADEAGTLLAFDLLTNGIFAQVTDEVRVYRAATPGGTIPSETPVATGTITVNPTLAFYRATLNTPVQFAAGENLWIAQRNTSSMIRSAATTGVPALLPTYTRPRATGTTWSVSDTRFPVWRWICQGPTSSWPRLRGSGEPNAGTTFPFTLERAASNRPALFYLGASNSSWNSLPLPFDLGIVGAAGCSVYASLDVIVPGFTDANGVANWSLTIPSEAGLLGARIHAQSLVVDGVNALGLVTSSAVTMLIGAP